MVAPPVPQAPEVEAAQASAPRHHEKGFRGTDFDFVQAVLGKEKYELMCRSGCLGCLPCLSPGCWCQCQCQCQCHPSHVTCHAHLSETHADTQRRYRIFFEKRDRRYVAKVYTTWPSTSHIILLDHIKLPTPVTQESEVHAIGNLHSRTVCPSLSDHSHALVESRSQTY